MPPKPGVDRHTIGLSSVCRYARASEKVDSGGNRDRDGGFSLFRLRVEYTVLTNFIFM